MTALWRGMDHETLTREYSPSSMLDHPIDVWIARYAAESAAARDALAARAHLGLPYGPGPAEVLDYFPADGPAGRPVLVFIHGGYWQALGRGDSAFFAPAMTAAGVDCVALDYTLAPHARMDGIVDEVRRALLWLTDHASEFGGNGRRLVIAGHSAGAHLCAMMLASDWQGKAPGIAGAVLIGGVFELEPIRLTYVNEALGMDVAETARNSPARLARRLHCPLALCWGEHDTPEFRRQSREMAALWGADDAWEQQGRHHFDSPLELGLPGTRLFETARRMALASGD